MQNSLDWIEALYIHIPFCRKICPFCAFAVRKERASLHKIYLRLVLQELQKRVDQFEQQLGKIASLYIGGGTPSSLELEEVAFLLKTVQRSVDCAEGIEISFEINPEDATEEYIEGLRQIGINRMSLGVQSFQEISLATLQRNHTVVHSMKAVEILKATGISNFNLDLMFGIPGQTLETFQNDLNLFLQSTPTHLSLYSLDIEPNTLFAHQPEKVQWVEQNRDLTQEMYLCALAQMKSQGILQYEVSNFAKPHQESRSNLLVWAGQSYLGLGTGAHSYVQGVRWSNHRSLKNYQRALEKKEVPVAFEEELSLTEQANESLMLGLRQSAGFSVNTWDKKFAIAWPEQNRKLVEALQSQGYLQWLPPVVSLLPKGMMLADEITEQLMLG